MSLIRNVLDWSSIRMATLLSIHNQAITHASLRKWTVRSAFKLLFAAGGPPCDLSAAIFICTHIDKCYRRANTTTHSANSFGGFGEDKLSRVWFSAEYRRNAHSLMKMCVCDLRRICTLSRTGADLRKQPVYFFLGIHKIKLLFLFISPIGARSGLSTQKIVIPPLTQNPSSVCQFCPINLNTKAGCSTVSLCAKERMTSRNGSRAKNQDTHSGDYFENYELTKSLNQLVQSKYNIFSAPSRAGWLTREESDSGIKIRRCPLRLLSASITESLGTLALSLGTEIISLAKQYKVPQ